MPQPYSIIPFVRTMASGRAPSFISRSATAGLVGLLSRRRPKSSGAVWWIAAGVAAAAAAGAFLIAPAKRRDLGARLLETFQKTGGGLGKRFGRVVGEQVGAHPIGTAKVVHEAQELFGAAPR